jgi:hypothetical protein
VIKIIDRPVIEIIDEISEESVGEEPVEVAGGDGGVGFEGMAGQGKSCFGVKRKSLWTVGRPEAAGDFPRPGLVIPCRVAPQQSPTPFHQTVSS